MGRGIPLSPLGSREALTTVFNIGGPEMVVLALLALLVVGPEGLPRVIRTVAAVLEVVKKTARSVQSEFETSFMDVGQPIQAPIIRDREYREANKERLRAWKQEQITGARRVETESGPPEGEPDESFPVSEEDVSLESSATDSLEPPELASDLISVASTVPE